MPIFSSLFNEISLISTETERQSRSHCHHRFCNYHLQPLFQNHGTRLDRPDVSYFSTTSNKGIGHGDDKKETPNEDRIASNNNNGNCDDEPPPPSAWTQLQSIPNIITLTRMASTPFLSYWIIHENYTLAIYGCVFAAISDGMDGYIAKHHGGNTVLGTYLDPLADKVLINGLAVSLWYTGILPTPLIALWASKDIILLAGTGWYLYQEKHTVNFFDNSVTTKPLTVTPTMLGKVNTGLQFGTLAIGILTPVMGSTFPSFLLPSLCWVTGITTIGSVFSYTGRAGVKTSKDGLVHNKNESSDGMDNSGNKNNGTKQQ
jgi:cardiolipin synthase